MSILTEKEREDVYKYWLKSTTLTDEDGLIQITERAVLERLAGMELPKSPLATKQCNITYVCTCADDATTCPQPTVDLYTADQLHQAYAQGAASQLCKK